MDKDFFEEIFNFSVQRIRKAAKKSPGNQQKQKKRIRSQANNRLTVRTWRRSERAGAIAASPESQQPTGLKAKL